MTPDWLTDPDLPFVLILFVAVLVACADSLWCGRRR